MTIQINNQLMNCCFTIKSTTFLFLLICLVTSSSCLDLSWRVKRGTTTIGDLPQIVPPKMLKRGESKNPSPGWTHCIKYLKADVRWRSIRSVNVKHLQATQFQCSWFIESEIPGSQLRISFEKVDLGASDSCTQQFLELIDVAVGKSQGRFCGSKKIGDYVTVGQRARIDIQGEEKLVTKVRGKEEPFIISYKIVKEPAGFRIHQHKPDIALRNKVKVSVGTAAEKGKTIYGKTNQPGANNNKDDKETGSRSSLSIWQVIIIIVVCIAFVAIVVGVIIKRMIFDKKKKQEYLDMERTQSTTQFPGNMTSDDKKYLPGLITAVSLESDKISRSSADEKQPSRKKNGSNVIPRSTSKPEEPAKKSHKSKRHNSHDDVGSEKGKAKERKNINENEVKRESSGETSVDKAPKTRAPKEKEKRAETKKPDASVPKVVNDTPANRPTNKSRRDVGKSEVKKNDQRKNRPKENGESKKRKSNNDLNANHVKPKRNDVTKKDDVIDKDDTPSSRAKPVPKKKSHSTKSKRETSERTKKRSEKERTEKKRSKRETADQPEGKEQVDKTRTINREEKKRKGREKREKATSNGTKRRKTVSSAHKKTSNTGKKDSQSKSRSSRHAKKESSEEKPKRKRQSKPED